MKQYDYLVVGAGLYGAVFAQEAKRDGFPELAEIFANAAKVAEKRWKALEELKNIG